MNKRTALAKKLKSSGKDGKSALKSSGTRSKAATRTKRNYSARKRITTEAIYQATLAEIDKLMRLGEKNLTALEVKRLSELATAAEEYEDKTEPLPGMMPTLIRNKLNEMGLSQTYAATLLGVSDTKFSQIMNGKQKPDVYFLKAVHEKLHVDGNVLLETV